MEAVRKAASEAVDTIRNSPLFRRKFGNRPADPTELETPRPLHPESDRTPFVQGVYFQVDYLGKHSVSSHEAQDHGCTDNAVRLLWENSRDSPVAKHVSIKVTTTNLRIKELGLPEGGVLYEFPLFRVSYCGTDKVYPEALSLVAKDTDGKFYCYVFRCANKGKAYTLALTVSKAFYLAYQILQAQEGHFPPTPERELLFEPQTDQDTKEHPARPTIPQSDLLDGDHLAIPSGPRLRVTHPSQTSMESDTLAAASADEDFARLAKARSNPDILRSTLDDHAAIKGEGGAWSEYLRLHADPGSQVPSPFGSTEFLSHDQSSDKSDHSSLHSN